ncbi:hypothetical protein BDV95DRAFT_603345 [Massariosphaeria phaeospora]|uniref:Chromodomain-helicase-DNA-binding protein 1-like C-terminal domain-containing protein n=1 Tax=Massariosphaeria phaeospora TaxID=100035 RepID=A0A7C8MI14_9PLEO|nr:hypothetical protein BDV95DRAFT_603345 [Massariosphaeria phaeospora]
MDTQSASPSTRLLAEQVHALKKILMPVIMPLAKLKRATFENEKAAAKAHHTSVRAKADRIIKGDSEEPNYADYTAVLRDRVRPIGLCILQHIEGLPAQEQGAMELQLCRYVAQHWWPLPINEQTHLRIMELYRNDFAIRGRPATVYSALAPDEPAKKRNMHPPAYMVRELEAEASVDQTPPEALTAPTNPFREAPTGHLKRGRSAIGYPPSPDSLDHEHAARAPTPHSNRGSHSNWGFTNKSAASFSSLASLHNQMLAPEPNTSYPSPSDSTAQAPSASKRTRADGSGTMQTASPFVDSTWKRKRPWEL